MVKRDIIGKKIYLHMLCFRATPRSQNELFTNKTTSTLPSYSVLVINIAQQSLKQYLYLGYIKLRSQRLVPYVSTVLLLTRL